MKRDCCKLLYFILFMKIYSVSLTYTEIGEDTWMDPDAWARDHIGSGASQSTNDKCCKCSENILEYLDPIKSPKGGLLEDSASLIYFKKFVSMLFSRKNFKYDAVQQIYERSIVFTIQSHQMDKLEQLQDPRDLDNLLMEIVSNVRTPDMYFDGQQQFHSREAATGIMTIVLNILFDMLQLIKTSEMRFLLAVAVVIIIAWTINNRFKIGWMALVFGGMFIYGYLHTYLECNRELEVNRMLEILNRDKGNGKNAKSSKFISFLKGMFYSEDNEEQKINLFSGVLFFGLTGYILKLTFKYILSPSAWAQFMHRKQTYHSEQAGIKSTTTSQDDRISGDNLKLLLNAMNSAPQRIVVTSTLPPMAGVSGVEDVGEAIESSIEKTPLKLDKCTFEKNENSNENPSDEKLGDKVEDLSDDS